MKIRRGFVSNSSSSSFIVASKEENPIFKLAYEINLADYGYKITNINELNDYVYERWIWTSTGEEVEVQLNKLFEENENLKEEYDSYVDLLNQGYIVYTGSFSSEDGGIEGMLCENGLEENVEYDKEKIKVIQGDGGY